MNDFINSLTKINIKEALIDANNWYSKKYKEYDGIEEPDIKGFLVDVIIYLFEENKPKGEYEIWANRMDQNDYYKKVIKKFKNKKKDHYYYAHEHIVDICLVKGNKISSGRPFSGNYKYDILLAAESEGAARHVKLLSQKNYDENDILWDFWKLLMMPAHVRILQIQSKLKSNQVDKVFKILFDYAKIHKDKIKIFEDNKLVFIHLPIGKLSEDNIKIKICTGKDLS